jgi:hypothetical protein
MRFRRTEDTISALLVKEDFVLMTAGQCNFGAIDDCAAGAGRAPFWGTNRGNSPKVTVRVWRRPWIGC